MRRRNNSEPRRPFNWTRLGKNSSAGIVASIAGYASYWHMTEVALRAGERAELAHVMPLSVDGMLVVASIAMVDDRSQGLRPRRWARIGFVVGITASVAANVTAAQPTLLGRLVAAWPALALLLVVEILSSKGRAAKAAKAAAQALLAPPVVVPVSAPVVVPVAAPEPVQVSRTDDLPESPLSPAAPMPTITADELHAMMGPRYQPPAKPTVVRSGRAQPRREAMSPLTGAPLRGRTRPDEDQSDDDE